MEREKRNIVIIGGGAAGLCAGVLCARAGLTVTLLEKTEVCGRKLSMTGNGRCNLSNLRMEASCFDVAEGSLPEKLLAHFGVQETISFFSSVGILVRDEEGYLYPVSGQAQSVTEALVNAYLAAGGNIVYRRQVKEILPGTEEDGSRWTVRTAGECYPADAVILASGGLSGPKNTKSTGDGYYIAERLGASVTQTYPALCGLQSPDALLPKESGVRVRARVSFFGEDESLLAEECGEVQLTAGRVSGIPVMQASSLVAKTLAEGRRVTLSLDLFPETEDAAFARLCEERIAGRGRAEKAGSLGAFLLGFGHGEINRMILERQGLSAEMPLTEIPEARLSELLHAYRDLRFTVGGTDGFAHAQATEGGIALSSLTEELELKTAAGVYCIGELVDVCGRCGGYNLQWAWTSAMCAAGALTGGP